MTREECLYGNLYHERIYGTAPPVAQRMEDYLIMSATKYSAATQRLLLWILHVGSFIEQRTGDIYHQERLSRLLEAGGICHEDYQKVPKGFFPLDDSIANDSPQWLFPPLRGFALT